MGYYDTVAKEFDSDKTTKDDYIKSYLKKTDQDDDEDFSYIGAVGITAVTAGVSLFNTGVAVSNFLGADADKAYSTDYLTDDASSQYLNHKSGFDLAGDIVGGLIPGTLALKGIKAINIGRKTGWGKFFNDDYYNAKHRSLYRQAIKASRSGQIIDRNKFRRKTLALSVKRGIAEGAIFETVAYSSTTLKHDMSNEDLDGWDVAVRAGSAVATGVLFGSVLYGIGGVSMATFKLNKGLSRGRVADKTKDPHLANDFVPDGTRIADLKAQELAVKEAYKSKRYTGSVQSITTPITDSMNKLVAGLTSAKKSANGRRQILMDFVTESTPHVVSSAITGLRRISGVGTGKAQKTQNLSKALKAEIDTLGITGAYEPKLVQLLKINSTDPDLLSDVAKLELKKMAKDGTDKKYLQNVGYINLKTGEVAESITAPRLADIGIDSISTKGNYTRMHIISNGKLIAMRDSNKEAKRIISKKAFIEEEKQFPKKLSVKKDPEILEAMLYQHREGKLNAFWEKGNKNNAVVLPKGVEDFEELEILLIKKKQDEIVKILKKEPDTPLDVITRDMGVTEASVLHNKPVTIHDMLPLGRDDSLTDVRWMKGTYERNSFSLQRQEALLYDKRYVKGLEEQLLTASERILGRSVDDMPRFREGSLANVEAGSGLFHSATTKGFFQSFEQIASDIGIQTNAISKKYVNPLMEKLNPSFESIRHFDVVRFDLLRAMAFGQKNADSLIRHKTDTVDLIIPENLLKNKTIDDILDQNVEGRDFIQIDSDKTSAFLDEWMKAITKVSGDKKNSKVAMGINKSNLNPNHLYFPAEPIKYGATFSRQGLGANAETGMLRANSPEDLKDLVRRMREDGMQVTPISSFESYYRAIGEMDISRSFSMEMRDNMKRKGVDFNPKPNVDPDDLIDRLKTHISVEGRSNVRRAVEMMYSKQFSRLEYLHLRHTEFSRSGKKGLDQDHKYINSPALRLRRTMLDISQDNPVEFFQKASEGFEKHASRMFNRTKSMFSEKSGKLERRVKGEQTTIEEFNIQFGKDSGIKFDSFNEAVISSKPNIDKRQMQKFLGTANGIQATLMLRADGLDGVANAMSYAVIASPELKALARQVSEEKAGRLRKLLTLDSGAGAGSDTPLTDVSVMKSFLRGTSKFFTDKEFRQALIKDGIERNTWTQNGDRMAQMVDQLNSVGGHGFNPVREERAMRKLWNGVKKVAFFISDTMNDFTQFQVHMLARDIGKALDLPQRDIDGLIMTFKGRVMAMNIPSQKPTIFQGSLGTPLGLYQNYNLNVLSAMGRFSTDKQQALRFATLQSVTFGMQGLPGFEQVNSAVHSIHGREQGADLKSIIDDTTGTTLGKWLLYGSGSLIFDGGLYSRGDMTQRNQFIIPTTLDEVPLIRTVKQVWQGGIVQPLEDMRNGTSISTALFDGLSHVQVNRPLTGMIEAYRGYSTTGKGGLNHRVDVGLDLEHIRGTLSRFLGARPFEEALIRERNYRLSRYAMESSRELRGISGSLRRELLANDGKVSGKTLERFMQRYFQTGRNPEQFERWFKRIEKTYNKTATERLEKKIKGTNYAKTFDQFYK